MEYSFSNSARHHNVILVWDNATTKKYFRKGMLCEEIERLLHNFLKKIFEVMSEYVYYGHPRIVFTLYSIAFCNMKYINGIKFQQK